MITQYSINFYTFYPDMNLKNSSRCMVVTVTVPMEMEKREAG